MGSINVEGIWQVTNKERMVSYCIQEFEKLIKLRLMVCSKIHQK